MRNGCFRRLHYFGPCKKKKKKFVPDEHPKQEIKREIGLSNLLWQILFKIGSTDGVDHLSVNALARLLGTD